jgi:hypothetical protein
MEDKLGVALPPPNEQLPEEIEVQLSRLLSDAGKQLSAQHMKEQAQMQAQAQAQDPVFQLQQAELQVKQAEAQRKAAKDQVDAQLRQAELQRKAVKDQADIQIKEQELQIEAQEAGAKLAADRRKDATKLDLDILKATKGN